MDYAARYIEWVDQNKDRLPKMYNSVDVHNAIWADERLTVEVKTGMTDAFRGPYEAELKHQKMLKWVKIAVVILVIVIAFAIVFPELFSW